MAWQPGTSRGALQRAEAALKANPWRSDAVIARQARCSRPTAFRARQQMENAGLIPVIPVSRRQRRPQPRQQSATHSAILAGARTSREVADLAGVSVGGGRKALRRHRDREPIPELPPPPAECEQCGKPYVPRVRGNGGSPQRFCSGQCRFDWHNARRPRAVPLPPDYPVLTLPPAAFLAEGLCADPRTLRKVGYPWTSDDPQDRELARRICRSCSVQMMCAEWSLHLPREDSAIYAAMGGRERRRLRKASA
jgi:hypothetical protein